MYSQFLALKAEYLKNRHSRIIGVTFIAFSLAPLFGGIFMLLMLDKGYDGLSGAFKAKATLMSFEANWNSYLSLLSQSVGVGGVLIFGFVSSWLFGREYSDGTAKDLLALPVSRSRILNAKFIYYLIWCLSLVITNLLLGIIIGLVLDLPGWSKPMFAADLEIYFITTALVILLNTPVAFLALAGRGYLAPLGFVALILVLAQIIGALGFGNYFPWSVPGIYSGSGGADMKASLDHISFMLILITSVTGYISTILWWKYSDQTQ